MAATVTFTARCDRCPCLDAVWHGTCVNDRGTAYAYIVLSCLRGTRT